MKAKYLILVSLILAILTVGAVSASQDIAADDEMAVEDEGIEIEELSSGDSGTIADSKDSDTLEKSNDVEELDDEGFDLWCNSTVDLNDDAKSVIAEVDGTIDNGDDSIDVGGNDEFEYSYLGDFFDDSHIGISLDDLGADSAGGYQVDVLCMYEESQQYDITVGSGYLEVIETYDVGNFSIYWNEDITFKDDEVVNVWNYPTEGTLIVTVDGDKRFNATIDSPKDDVSVRLSDLNINSNGAYAVSAKFIVKDNSQEIDFGQKNINIDIDWNYDRYLSVFGEVNILSHSCSVVYILDYYGNINGTLTIFIDGKEKSSKNIFSFDEFDVIVDDLNLYNNIALGNHTVKAVYMKNGVEKHEVEKSVVFYANPDFESYFTLSVGENETFAIKYLKSFSGVATLYNASFDSFLGDFVKGDVVGSSKFSNGGAAIPFGSLTKGTHNFILNITGFSYEPLIEVYVEENTPGYSANVSASEIIVGNNVVVNFNGTESYAPVVIFVDDIEYALVELTTGTINQTVSGLAVGTHRIKVLYEYGSEFYSNTFYVTVKDVPKPKPTPQPAKKAAKVKLALKKVKVKKSAKKLVLQATLKINSKAKKGLKVTFKLKGKKVGSAKTNKKGVAKFTVNKKTLKKILKKVKAGKKIKIQATYKKTTKTINVKVNK